MTMLNRSAPDAQPTLALTTTEIAVLDRRVSDKPHARRRTLSHYLTKIARLGGYLARANDPPPGNTVMWRGLSRLPDIALGHWVGLNLGGNGNLHRSGRRRAHWAMRAGAATPPGPAAKAPAHRA